MTPKVLIVDDVKKFRDEIRLALEAEFEIVAEAADGLAAVEAYRKHRPDLVVMDIVMPKLSGIEATRILMEEPDPPKIVIVSGLKDDHIVLQALQAGAIDYLFKPVDAQKLCAVLWSFHEGSKSTAG